MPSADLINSAGMDMATVQAYVAAKQAEKVGKSTSSGSSGSGAGGNGGNLGLGGDGDDGKIPLVGGDGDDEVSFKDLDASRNYSNSFGNYGQVVEFCEQLYAEGRKEEVLSFLTEARANGIINVTDYLNLTKKYSGK